MERVMTVEEKIRRAEEIYERRKQGEERPVAKVAINDKKDIKLLKKMVIQVLICMTIYLIFYIVQNNQYVFSEDFINKANEILSYDTNFMELYEMIKTKIMNIAKTEQTTETKTETEPETEAQQQLDSEGNSEDTTNNNEAIGGAEAEIKEETQNLSQEEIDIENIKKTTSFIKPVEGIISSGYGQRDGATGSVPKNHTGTDIAASLGTKIMAATEGEVVLASEEGDYRKASKNSNWRS